VCWVDWGCYSVDSEVGSELAKTDLSSSSSSPSSRGMTS
jgi:hypothetical protein